jgi:hypothetical protein
MRSTSGASTARRMGRRSALEGLILDFIADHAASIEFKFTRLALEFEFNIHDVEGDFVENVNRN